MAVVKISPLAVRTFLLRHQLLLTSRSLSGPEAVDKVFRRLRLLQYDPLNPCGRNIDLVLQARITDYHPNDYADWAYDQREGVEGYDKVLCVLPIEDWQYLRFMAEHMSPTRRSFAQEHRHDLDRVVAKIRDDGPVPTNGIADERRVDIGWYGESPWGKVALETLWRMGELVVTRQAHGRKLYDIPERVYGEKLPQTPVTLADHVARRIESVGLLPASGSGIGWLGAGPSKILRPEILQMVERGELVEVAVEGVRQKYVVRAKDAEEFNKEEEFEPRMTFLAPLDNLLWDRQMILDVFGFFYRWEVYVPSTKRTYGYYVLPILYGTELVGRIEPVVKDEVLVIKNVWWEEGFTLDRQAQQAFDEAVATFKEYVKAERVEFLSG